MEEYDLVNEQDQVIGVTNKEKSHQDGGIHRAVAVFVFSPEGKLYVQEHIKSGGKFDHTVGGHVKKGESYDQAAQREADEEIGLKEDLQKISTFYSDETFTGSPIRHMFGLYECTPSEEWAFVENEEVKKLILMTLKEIVNLMNTQPQKLTGGFINTMKEYIKQKGLPL